MKKWEPLYLTLSNSKSEVCQGDYRDKIKKCSREGEFQLSKYVHFVQKGAVRKV